MCWRDELHASFNYFISFVRMVVGLGLDRCASGRERTTPNDRSQGTRRYRQTQQLGRGPDIASRHALPCAARNP